MVATVPTGGTRVTASVNACDLKLHFRLRKLGRREALSSVLEAQDRFESVRSSRGLAIHVEPILGIRIDEASLLDAVLP